ncbi:hypothetical protein [Paracoccus sediminicola]|uniref:hypothetical protein n=1 Tax=Paracoccus sediminicola TaxID=3017783 RepID=UPI0022F04413|nr:hypothetical protein [Paracoccus sediminicola]WBU57463.1 hypothetical protein PAF18_03190 [Paracoccus sediminicola]
MLKLAIFMRDIMCRAGAIGKMRCRTWRLRVSSSMVMLPAQAICRRSRWRRALFDGKKGEVAPEAGQSELRRQK